MDYVNPNKKLFCLENYVKLAEALGAAAKTGDYDAQQDSRDFARACESFHEYVLNVDMSETQIRLAYARFEGAELRDRVSHYDSMRRAYHERAIANTSLVNNMARFYGIEKIFLGDNADRYEVADFCLQITNEIFLNRRGAKN